MSSSGSHLDTVFVGYLSEKKSTEIGKKLQFGQKERLKMLVYFQNAGFGGIISNKPRESETSLS